MRRQTVTRITLSLTAVLIGLVAATPGAAQESEFEHCAKLESDTERLACFDATIKERRAPATAPARAEVSTAAPASPLPETEPELSAAPGQANSQKPPGAIEPSRQQDEKRTAERELPREYTAVVVAMRQRPHGQMVVTLKNGEVWSEQFASRAFLVDVGDTITMKKSRFTPAYRLVAPGGRGYKMTRLE